ncbi:hypothetical protein FNV43_RR09870 [Rhamnella rubrinervis]|uniref:Uncharacterized protein n=1 Tax=Rhamnella rubrinervis TaxID=2594499 RepID=A0A8K0HC49_9ROSA|nr:hypothetical protein FNV43_RR09870 [Rhamnella rubrinervis]
MLRSFLPYKLLKVWLLPSSTFSSNSSWPPLSMGKVMIPGKALIDGRRWGIQGVFFVSFLHKAHTRESQIMSTKGVKGFGGLQLKAKADSMVPYFVASPSHFS